MKLEIISAKNPAVRVETSRVSVPAVQGPFVVLKNHAPIVAALGQGDIVWDGGSKRINSGFVKVLDNIITAVVED